VSALTLRFIGSGAAFGDGGRFQACILLSCDAGTVLVDCGASSLIAMKQAAIDPNTIDAIVISHFHGDHFGGIPFFLIDGTIAKRDRPLVIAGPLGIERHVRAAAEALFPGSAEAPRVTAIPVSHTPATVPHGLRVELGGRTVGYSGDTEWTDALVEIAAHTDAFICECLSMSKDIPLHLNAKAIVQHRRSLNTQRLILTHLGTDMLKAGHVAGATIAHDGLVVTLA
jgi:ribonuclease BN (tRNA processing enzyme)